MRHFYYKFIFRSIIILMFSLLLMSMANQEVNTIENIEESINIDQNNRLSKNGHTLYLPRDWKFKHNATTVPGSLLYFTSPDGIEGSLETLTIEKNIDNSKLIKIYEDFLNTQLTGIKTIKDSNSDISIIIAHNNLRNYVIRTEVVENKATFLILFSPLTIEMNSLIPMAKAIYDSYHFEESRLLSIREINNFPIFYNLTDSWYWHHDYKDGYYLAKNGEDEFGDVYLGIYSITKRELESDLSNEQVNIMTSDYNIRVANIELNTIIYTINQDDRSSNIYINYEVNNILYQMHLIQKIVKNNTVEELIDRQNIQDFLDYNMNFSKDVSYE